MESAYYLVGFLMLQTIIFTFLYLIYTKYCDSESDNKRNVGWDPTFEEIVFKLERIETDLQNGNIRIANILKKTDDLDSKVSDLTDCIRISVDDIMDHN